MQIKIFKLLNTAIAIINSVAVVSVYIYLVLPSYLTYVPFTG
jgi:hypothetical protein